MLTTLIAWFTQLGYALGYWASLIDWPVALGLVLAFAVGDVARRIHGKRRQREASARVTSALTAQTQRAEKRLMRP